MSGSDRKILKSHHQHLCHGPVTDDEFLEHMIPHHQMAIDMAQQVSKYSKNPAILSLARDIIWSQQNEIWMMKALLRSPSFCSLNLQESRKAIPTCPQRQVPRKYTENNLELSYYYPYQSEDYSVKGNCSKKFMIPCGKQGTIVNNYNRKICKPDFWKGLSL